MHQIGRCDAPNCDRSARASLEVVGTGARTAGLVCAKHAAHTELGALLLGRTVSPKHRTRA